MSANSMPEAQGTQGEVRPSRARRALAIAGLWALFGGFFTLQSYSYRRAAGQSAGLLQIAALDLFFVLLWALLTPFVLWLSNCFRRNIRSAWRRTAALVGCGIALAVAQRFLFDLVVMSIRATEAQPFRWAVLGRSILASFDYGVFLFGIVVLIDHAVDSQAKARAQALRASRLEAALSSARLESLERQLQPHFLFNTLNAIAALVPSDPPRAQALVGKLGDLLRATLAEPEGHEVSLRREIEWLEQYLAIESARVGERLRVTVEVDPAALPARVPRLLFQPLVENALKHGVAARPGPARVSVEARRRDQWLELSVRDEPEGAAAVGEPGPLGGNGRAEGFGIGLANTRSRLAALYGDEQELRLEALPRGGSELRVRLPYRLEGSA